MKCATKVQHWAPGIPSCCPHPCTTLTCVMCFITLHSLQSGFLVDCVAVLCCHLTSNLIILSHGSTQTQKNTELTQSRTCSEDSCFPLIIVHHLESKRSDEYFIHQSLNFCWTFLVNFTADIATSITLLESRWYSTLPKL